MRFTSIVELYWQQCRDDGDVREDSQWFHSNGLGSARRLSSTIPSGYKLNVVRRCDVSCVKIEGVEIAVG